LTVDGLTTYYGTLRGRVRAVESVSFSLERGEVLGLVGESGCGKTTVGISLMRLFPKNVVKSEGLILLDGMDISRLSESDFRREIRWRRISMVFQGAMNALNPVLKVGFQVAEPLTMKENMDKKQALKRVRELFTMVGLPPEYSERYPHELSGGMKQRTVIAMAITLKPDIIILDEPTSALDVSIQAQVMNLFKKLKREQRLSMIFITHDIALASDLCDKIAVMYAGEIVELGTAEAVLLSPKHPYTQKLLAATPRLREESKLEYIQGAPPDLVSPPAGCRFHPRCPFAFEKCIKVTPSLLETDAGHSARCWLYA